MAHILLKPSADEDFYVYWSTVVDMPIGWGDNSTLRAMEDFAEELSDADRWYRADKTGTSEQWYTASFNKPNRYNYGGYGWIARSDLKKLTDVYDRLGVDIPEDHPELLAQITPWED